MKRIFHRVISFILTLALLGPLFQPLELHAKEFSYDLSSDEAADLLEEGSEEFQIYLADFLMQYPKLDSDLEQEMLHRQVYEALCTDGKYYKSVDWYQNLTDKGALAFVPGGGKESLYREMLLELIQMQLSTKESQEQLQNRYAFWSETVLENVAIGLDIVPEAVSGGAIYEVAHSKSAEEIWDIISKSDLMTKEAGNRVNTTITEFDYNMAGAKMLVSGAKNGLDYLSKLPVYLALAETREGMLGTLKLMYRRTQNTDLQTALYQIIESLETEAGNEDIAKIVAHLQFESAAAGIQDIAKSFISDALGIAGMTVNLSELYANAVLNANDIGEASLMLEAIVNIEDEVKNAVVYSLNTYRGDYEDAIVLNQSVALLYDVYEYGTDLANTFFEEAYENGLLNKVKNVESTLYNNWKTVTGQKGKESVRSLYPSWVKTYRNIAIVGRSVFASVLQMYKEETGNAGIVMDVDMDSFPVYVDELKTDNEVIVLGESGHGKVDVTFSPANAQNVQLTYESSDDSIVTVDSNGLLTAKGVGTAVITIATADKAKSVTREVVVEEEKVEEKVEEKEEEISLDIALDRDLMSSCLYNNINDYIYEENSDGITLKAYILLTYEECAKWNILEAVKEISVWDDNSKVFAFIPAYIDGKPVTQLSLSSDQKMYSAKCRETEKYYRWTEEDLVIKYLPTTVKKIWGSCFKGCTFTNSFVLHDGVELIGAGAFEGCTFLGWKREEEKKRRDIENPFFEIPSSVNEIGYNAFDGCKWGYRSIIINTNIEEILRGSFSDMSEVDTICFAEDTTIKLICDSAFSGTEANSIWIPDTVEKIGNSAFEGCGIINNLPVNIKEIGESAFLGATFADSMREYVFKEEMKEIPPYAFSGLKNGLEIIYLPDTIENIGDYALSYEGLERVYTYESSQSNKPRGKIGSCAFGNAEYIEIPSNVVSLGRIDGSGELVLPAGLEELETLCCTNYDKGWIIRTADGEAGQNGVIRDRIYTGGIESLELPGAFVGLFHKDDFDFIEDNGFRYNSPSSTRIQSIFVKGNIKALSERWQKKLDMWSVGTLYALDENGEAVCLYRGPSTYKKFSQKSYENEQDYTIVFPEETQRITSQKIQYAVVGNDGAFSMKEMAVRINAEDEIYSAIEDGKVSIQYWSEDSKGSRAAELGSYFDFEDLYLQQDEYAYFNVSIQNKDGLEIAPPEGDYQIIMEIPSDWYDFGLYHISESGRITRLKGEYYSDENGHAFRALSEELGSFAVIKKTKTSEEVQANWLEELHELWDTQKSEVSTEPQQEEVTNGKVSVWVTDTPTKETENKPENSQPSNNKQEVSTLPESSKQETDMPITSQVTIIQTNDRIWLKDELGLELDAGERILEIYTSKEKAELAIHVEAEEEIKPILVYVDEEKGKLDVQKLQVDHVLTEEEQVLTDKGIVLPDGTVAEEEELQGTTLLEEIKAAESVRMKKEVQNEVTLKKPGRYLVILSTEKEKTSVFKIVLYMVLGIVAISILCFTLYLYYCIQLHKKKQQRAAARKKRMSQKK